MVYQVISLVGAVLILGAYAAQQLRGLEAGSPVYQTLNLVGGVLLCVVAIAGRQYGFILLEGSWAALSAWALWKMRPAG